MKRPWPAAAAAVLALLAGALLVFTPVYQQNDDVAMTMIASGRGLALEPSPHLVYVNVVLGELLSRAYGFAPGPPWYGLLLVATLAATLVALLGCRLGSARFSPGAAGAAFAAYFAAIGIVFLVRLQFTAVAGLAAGAGLALFASELDPQREPHARGVASRAAPAALVLLGGLLRFQALLLALVVAAPLVALRAWRADRARARGAAAWLFAVLALAGALQLFDRAVYERDPGWREFRELNGWRARIVDYGAGEGPQARALEARLGWSANDGVVLRRWLYADRVVFSTARLRALVEAAPLARPAAGEARARVREAFSAPSLVPLALVLPLLTLGLRPGERARLLLLALAPGVLVLAALAVLLRAPEHVALPALGFAPTALLALGHDRVPGRTGRLRTLLPPALLLLAVAGAAPAWQRARVEGAAAQDENRDLRRSVALLAGTGARLCVEWAGAFRYEAVLPLEDQSYLAGPVRLFSLGWPQRSPVADRVLSRLGIDDVVRSLYERDDVALLMNPLWQPSLATYVREHYGAEIAFEATVRTPSFTVFRVLRVDRAGAPADVVGRP